MQFGGRRTISVIGPAVYRNPAWSYPPSPVGTIRRDDAIRVLRITPHLGVIPASVCRLDSGFLLPRILGQVRHRFY